MIRSFKGKFAEPILQDRTVPKGFRQTSQKSRAESSSWWTPPTFSMP